MNYCCEIMNDKLKQKTDNIKLELHSCHLANTMMNKNLV